MCLLQAPFASKDWMVLPTSVIALGFLVYVGVWAAEKLGLVKKNGIAHKTFADNAEQYWEHMREVVTEPLAEVLKTTNEILGELRDRAIRQEGAQAERDRRDKNE